MLLLSNRTDVLLLKEYENEEEEVLSLFPLPGLRRPAGARRRLHSLPHLRLHPLRLLAPLFAAVCRSVRLALTYLRHQL